MASNGLVIHAGVDMNILVVRIGRMGDVLMTLPALHEIIRKFPTAKIDVLTSPDGVRVFSLLKEQVNNVWCFRNSIKYRLGDACRLAKIFKSLQYDKVFCIESKTRYVDLVRDSAAQLILVNDHGHCHFSYKCLRMVADYPVDTEFRGQRQITITNESQQLVKQVLTENGLTHFDRLIALHPTYSGTRSVLKKSDPHKTWSTGNWAQLARLIDDAYRAINQRVCIVMNLLPGEQRVGQEIVSKSQGLVKLLCLPPNFASYAAFIDTVDLLIAPNTGVMHLAAALNTPVVTLFSKFKAWGCGPFLPNDMCRVLIAEDYPDSCGLDAIPPQDVAQAAVSLNQSICKEQVC